MQMTYTNKFNSYLFVDFFIKCVCFDKKKWNKRPINNYIYMHALRVSKI